MQYEEIPAGNIILDRADRSLLIVESTIPKPMFQSTRGIKPGSVKEEKPGVWYVYLEPGVQLVSIMAEGYLPIEDLRHNFQPRQAWRLRITPKVVKLEGHGNVSIMTDPPACYVVFNRIRLPEKTPLTLQDQPTGDHKIQFDGGFEWVPLDTMITVHKDSTVSYNFRLSNRQFDHLKLTSDPPGAEVYFDDKSLGKTPIDRNDMIAGEYTVKLNLVDHYPSSEQITLREGEVTSKHIELKPHTGILEVFTEPADAEITIDGDKIGTSPVVQENITVGLHKIIASINGYYETEDSSLVEYGKTTNLKLELKPKPGNLVVTSEPVGASLFLNCKLHNQVTPAEIDSVPVGVYRLHGRLLGYHKLVKNVRIEPGGYAELDLSFRLKQRSEAVKRSLWFPGSGQRFAEHKTRGWLITAAQVAAIAFAGYAYMDYFEKSDAYDEAYDIYRQAFTGQELSNSKQQLINATDDRNQAAMISNTALAVIGGVYTLNILDVTLLEGGRIRIKSMNMSLKTERRTK